MIRAKRTRARRQQEPRSVSASLAGLGSLVSHCAAPDACTFADGAHGLSRLHLRRPHAQWSRPMPARGCSVVARMPRYAPAPSGIHSESRIPATGQNGSSRHVLALFDSSSRRINEHSSGLLIRGFGVQVPGGAPVLTWDFITSGHFYVSVLSTWLLRGCSRARTQQSGACQKRVARRRIQGHESRIRAASSGRHRAAPVRPMV
jgi:hypothetical protein